MTFHGALSADPRLDAHQRVIVALEMFNDDPRGCYSGSFEMMRSESGTWTHGRHDAFFVTHLNGTPAGLADRIFLVRTARRALAQASQVV